MASLHQKGCNLDETLFFSLLSLILVAFFYYILNRHFNVSHTQLGPLQIEEPANEPLYIFALGDSGSGDENQYAVAAAMEERCQQLAHLDGLLLLGDLFYMEGISSTEDKQWEEKIEKPYGSACLSKANIYPIFGNHDYRGNKEAFIEYGKSHSRWKIPNRFYSLNFSNLAKFISIDSNFLDLCFDPETCVIDFLKQELNDKAHKWKIVLSHYPLASASMKGYHHNGDAVFGTIAKGLACGNADLWISGHAHHLEHRRMKNCSTDLLVSGGGGGDLEDIRHDEPEMKFGASSFGFLELEISQNSVIARFHNKNSHMIFEKEIRK